MLLALQRSSAAAMTGCIIAGDAAAEVWSGEVNPKPPGEFIL
jgi:hypothetical protein